MTDVLSTGEKIEDLAGEEPRTETFFQRYPKRDMIVAKVALIDGSERWYVDATYALALAGLLATLMQEVSL